ncbi:hypothetical protein ACPA54_24500 [Uniformispora flossi]|uniref:hypothetical protein n=1 Tax=Uniformispora flossi TaxID=3390723 RepID=UPI003C2E5C39
MDTISHAPTLAVAAWGAVVLGAVVFGATGLVVAGLAVAGRVGAVDCAASVPGGVVDAVVGGDVSGVADGGAVKAELAEGVAVSDAVGVAEGDVEAVAATPPFPSARPLVSVGSQPTTPRSTTIAAAATRMCFMLPTPDIPVCRTPKQTLRVVVPRGRSPPAVA